MNSVMFSVIIPLYNKAPYIEKAILSVCQQTYKEFELIIIDDGSTDGGYKLVSDLFSILSPPLGGWGVHTQPNQGVSVTRNKGVNLAKYEYVAFLDADDWWDVNYLEQMSRLVRKYPEAGIYACSYFKVKDGKHIPAHIGVEPGFVEGEINYFQVYAKTLWQPVWTGATIISKKVFQEENGFQSRLKLGEDFDLWTRITLQHKVVLLNQPLAYYNQDVEQQNRAIGKKLYEPSQHFLYSDYSRIDNKDFKRLFDRLAVYGLLPYYVAGKNQPENKKILQHIDWKEQEIKYRIQYRVLPRFILRIWLDMLNTLWQWKKRITG